MPTFNLRAQKLLCNNLQCRPLQHSKHVALRRAARMPARAAAAQPSPEDMAQMQEAMQAAMKDPQALLASHMHAAGFHVKNSTVC